MQQEPKMAAMNLIADWGRWGEEHAERLTSLLSAKSQGTRSWPCINAVTLMALVP